MEHPAGCSRTPYDDDPLCDICGMSADACQCPECPECKQFGRPECLIEHGLTVPGVVTVQKFLDHIGCCDTLRGTLRAIDRHSTEHVWIRVCGSGRLYYHTDLDTLRAVRRHSTVTHVGASCIAWDGSDWEFSIEVECHSPDDINYVRAACEGGLAEYESAP